MYIAVDPGFRSGTCIAESFDASGNFNVTACIEIHWNDRFYYYDLITAHKDAIKMIIVEDFKLTKDPRKLAQQYKSRMPSSQIIGIIEAAAHASGILNRVVYQEPKDKEQVTILPIHYPVVGISDHNKDAYRHMHYYVRMNRIKR